MLTKRSTNAKTVRRKNLKMNDVTYYFQLERCQKLLLIEICCQLPLTDIFKLFQQPHAELYQSGLLRLAPENSFYFLISAFFNATSRQQIYRIRADSVRQSVKDEFYLVGFSVFHLLKFGGKQLGYFHHRKKENITDNSQLVHSFLGGGWSGCYLCIFALLCSNRAFAEIRLCLHDR